MECLSKREKNRQKDFRIKSTVDCNERSGRLFSLWKNSQSRAGNKESSVGSVVFYNLKCYSEILYLF